MKAADLPRHYHFFCGERRALTPEKVFISSIQSYRTEVRGLDVAEALDLMRRKAAMYKNPFDIEIYGLNTPEGAGVEVKLANRAFALRGAKRYMYHVPHAQARDREVLFATWQEMFQYFEDRLVRYVMGEERVWTC